MKRSSTYCYETDCIIDQDILDFSSTTPISYFLLLDQHALDTPEPDQHALPEPALPLSVGEMVIVPYEDTWYPGRVIKTTKNGEFWVSFLKRKENSNAHFVFPSRADKQRVRPNSLLARNILMMVEGQRKTSLVYRMTEMDVNIYDDAFSLSLPPV